MGKTGSEQRPRWLKWLHRVGYVTTALVLIQILGTATFITVQLTKYSGSRATIKDLGATQEGPLPTYNDSITTQLFKLLPSLNSLQEDGLRFAVTDSAWSDKNYALSLYLPEPNSSEAKGMIIISEDLSLSTKQHHFTIPESAYHNLVKEFDKHTDGWKGGEGIRIHAYEVSFERVRGERITSGRGHSYPYTEIRSLILITLKEHAPNEDLPKDPSWTN